MNVDTPTTSKPPPVILSPCLAVAIPAESTFLTSSYVNVPKTLTLPENCPVLAVSAPTVIAAVPVSPCALVASVAVLALPVKAPTKVVAVTTPWNSAPFLPTIKPLLYTVAPVPIGVSAPRTFIPAASTPTL